MALNCHREKTTMIMIFHELNAEIYPVTIDLPVATQRSDCDEVAGLLPTRTKTLWVSIAAVWSYITKTLGESEFGFPSDY
jgi:hypothetical protein